VFKLAVAAAALEERVVTPADMFFDPGFIDVDGLRIRGWDFEKGGRGELSSPRPWLTPATVLIQVGMRLGAAKFIEWAEKLGFGRKTKLDFDGEADGNLPPRKAFIPVTWPTCRSARGRWRPRRCRLPAGRYHRQRRRGGRPVYRQPSDRR
jgi:cell division protein FtsI/penicillin-binding protein 2